MEWRPNNSPAAVAHLLSITGATHVVVPQHFVSKLQDAVDTDAGKLGKLRVILQPDPDIYKQGRVAPSPWEYPLAFEKEMELPFVIIHSSGSTGFPSVRLFFYRSWRN